VELVEASLPSSIEITDEDWADGVLPSMALITLQISYVKNSSQNVMSLSRKCAGRLFQTRGPATAKLLSPNVLCVRGTAHDLSVEERSRRQ